MPTAIVTGSGGLIGSESVQHFVRAGYDVIGLENDMRSQFFGPSASASHTTARLVRTLEGAFTSHDLDIRNADEVDRVFASVASSLTLVIHAAAQPSHDWAASDPQTDFTVNANGTLNLVQATLRHAAEASFIFCSTIKVYGDRPNDLPLQDIGSRLELPEDHRYRGASTRRCRSTHPPTRCSESPRPRPTCWCRNTVDTSGCEPCAFGAAA